MRRKRRENCPGPHSLLLLVVAVADDEVVASGPEHCAVRKRAGNEQHVGPRPRGKEQQGDAVGGRRSSPSRRGQAEVSVEVVRGKLEGEDAGLRSIGEQIVHWPAVERRAELDRKSTRLNSSHS